MATWKIEHKSLGHMEALHKNFAFSAFSADNVYRSEKKVGCERRRIPTNLRELLFGAKV